MSQHERNEWAKELIHSNPKPGTPMSWVMPWVEIDLKTGKPIHCGTDS